MDGPLELRYGQAGNLARLRCGRHPAGQQQAGRGLPRPDGERRPGSWRRTQRGSGGEYRGRDRGEAADDARQDQRLAAALAGHRRRTDGGQGISRAIGVVQEHRRDTLHARGQRPRRVMGRQWFERVALGRIPLSWIKRTRGRRAVERQERPRRGDVDGTGMGVQARASAAAAALALCDQGRRRSAKCRAEYGEHLVLLPRAGLSAHDGAVRDRQEGSRGCGDDDRHQGRHDCDSWLGLVGALQQADRAGDARQRADGGHAEVG